MNRRGRTSVQFEDVGKGDQSNFEPIPIENKRKKKKNKKSISLSAGSNCTVGKSIYSNRETIMRILKRRYDNGRLHCRGSSKIAINFPLAELKFPARTDLKIIIIIIKKTYQCVVYYYTRKQQRGVRICQSYNDRLSICMLRATCYVM